MGETRVRTTAWGASGAEAGLVSAVTRLEAELAAYRPDLPDRAVAEEELAALVRQARAARGPAGPADTERLRRSLLLVVAALGSVSALAEPLGAVREAVEALAPPG